MDQTNPFYPDKLTPIFNLSSGDPSRLISRESGFLEFKQSFGWGGVAKYMKTCAAYANTKGGYIVFGISNNPHKLIGLTPEALKLFESLDPEKLTESFNEHFAPEIEWSTTIHEINDKQYGLLYVAESQNKPVMCIKNKSEDIQEGDIYYRYRGRTERIKYPELRSILEHNRENEQKIWMDHLSRISKIGVQDVGIFNINTGLVTGKGSNSFLIDESLLSQLSFIKEGEFSEIKGKPTLKLLGNLQAIDSLPIILGERHIVKIPGIRLADIVLNFLDQSIVPDPEEYIKQICFESSAFLPVYFYMHIGKLNIKKTKDIINLVVSRNRAKEKLVERLDNGIIQSIPIADNNSKSANIKKEIVSKIKQGQIDQELTAEYLEHSLQAIRGLSCDEVRQAKDLIFHTLKFWFNKHYNDASPALAGSLRRAICWVDEALYMQDRSDELMS